ncbi:hypothetical protein [Pedobacter agri]|uniref:Bacteriocin n=1 Tax=Pedobacter agri TaxID=454586 RepID=A0A9X3I814_9SPHI|nr:hypothetical protein [Pedobacter agri]MCX3264266.1 hypothetical protein [Pedobacter agri]RZL41162.1 MAG: hypothetical protein EOO93_30205 [Pedobacter sp.]
MENLSAQELLEIGGGGIFGNTQQASGISISATSDSLLSITFITTNGDRRNETTISVGNDIALDLGFIGNRQ